ncbi:hypothetical protein [Sphingomonas sp.]|uniref:hypothetical protein n=1 Tax=Sphingomonas sp. TaxID=28214 RepID=UPI0038AD509C
MRPSLRFLAIAIVGWAGMRAAALGVLPGGELFRIERSEAKTPPIVPTQFPPIEPVALAPPAAASEQYYPAAYAQQAVRPVMVPVYYAAPVSTPAAPRATPYLDSLLPPPRRSLYSPAAAPDEWPMSRLAAAAMPPRTRVSEPPPALPVAPLRPRLDRLQLTSWALLRSQQTGLAGSRSLASGGQLGASQAGARVLYNFNRLFALSGRMSSEVGRRGGEVAAGVRVHPLIGLPVWLTAERRQRIGRFGGGRSDFALFAEAGVYDRPLPWGLTLDSYLQGGVVGVKSRDLFVDGALAVTRPVYRKFSAGFGIWGGAQPGLSRLDAGPRLTVRVRGNLKVHADWRQKLAGNARPGSGPALTLAGDF